MQKTNTALSIKMTKDEVAMIEKKAKECGETKSRYARRVLTESVMNPLYTGEDVMRLLMQIGCGLRELNESNANHMIVRFNQKGGEICRILSSR